MPEVKFTPESESSSQKTICSFCGNTSQDKVILHGIYQEKPVLVCTACLPRLIHG